MGHDGHDPDETPNHHLPRMSDLHNSSGQNHHLPNMADMDNPSGRHHLPPTPRMGDMDNPSDHHHRYQHSHHQNKNNGPPPPAHHGKPVQFYTQSPPVDGLPLPHGKPSGRHNHSPPLYGQGHGHNRSSSRAGAFASIATLLLILALTALVLYLIYRPDTPHFTVVAASIYLLNTTYPTASISFDPPPTASFLATSMQFTVVTRNPHRRTSLYYDHLRAQVYYRDQAITPPTELPPLYHVHHSTVVFSPVLGGGEARPVAPGVVEGLVADETYGMMGLKLVVMGRVRYKAGFIWTVHYGVYVGCDLLVGVKKGVVGAVPLLANHDCKVDM